MTSVFPGLSEQEIALMQQDTETAILIMSCTIERFRSTGVDEDGHATGVWDTLHASIPCWYWEQSNYRRFVVAEITGPNINEVDLYSSIMLPAGTDVTERDRVTEVRDSSGALIAQDLDIRNVSRMLTSVRLMVESQT